MSTLCYPDNATSSLINILATSIDVERLFSCGHLIITHAHSRLSAQMTCALLCLGAWSFLGLVKAEDGLVVAALGDVEGDKEALEDGWDSIVF